MYAAVRSRVSIFAFRYAFMPATSGSSVRVHRYGSCNSRVSWCAYLYVISPSDSGVTSACTRAMRCFMVRMVHEATIFCNTSTGGASPVGTAATWTGTGVTLALLVPSWMGDWQRCEYEYESLVMRWFKICTTV